MKSNYERLLEIQKQHPELTFDNDGYEYLPKKVKEDMSDVIEEIEGILKEEIAGFVRFDNFKPRKDPDRGGEFAIRCQYNWGEASNTMSFVGVGYFGIEYFKEEEASNG